MAEAILTPRHEGRSIPMALAIDGWLADCGLAGMSPLTVKNYRSGTRVLLTQEHVTDLTPTLVRELMAAKIRKGHALSSCKTFFGYVCSFSNWAVRCGYLVASPMREIPCPKPPERPHRYLSVDQVRALMAAARASRRRPEEHELILRLLLEGLRANELCQLRWCDVKEDRIVVAFGKGGKVRAVRLSPEVRDLLAARERTGPRIFQMSVNALEERLQWLGKRAGVPHCHPHLLRHTFASHALMRGLDTDALRSLGGWSANSMMILKYTRSVQEDAAILRADALGLTESLLADG